MRSRLGALMLRAGGLAAVLWLASVPPAGALSLAPGVNFTGQTFEENFGGFTVPPDTMGTVGRDHIVEILNSGFAVYDKDTGSPLGGKSLDQFWSDAGVTIFDTFDPRILYDPATDRFFAAALDRGGEPNNILVAVSDSGDPTAGWTGFAVDSSSSNQQWADFPMLGLDADGVYVSAILFRVGTSGGLPVGSDVLVLPKGDLVAPTPSIANATLLESVSLATAGFNPYPAVDLDGGGLPNKLWAGAASFLGVVQVSQLDGPITAPTITANVPMLVDALGIPPFAAQPGTSQGLDPRLDTRFHNVVERDGSVWTVQSVADPDSGRAAIRWFEIDEATNIILQSGLLGDESLDLIFPSIAVNELDQVVIGFTGSSESQFASSYAVLGETVGNTTTFGDFLLLGEGGGVWTLFNGRFGDFSATVVDPEDPSVFWTFQEIVVSNENWGVRITQLFVVPEPATALLVALGLAALARGRPSPAR